MLLFRAVLLIMAISIAMVTLWRRSPPRDSFFGSLLVLTSLAWVVEVAGLITSQLAVRNTALYNLYAMVELPLLMGLVRVLRPSWLSGLLTVSLLGELGMAWVLWGNDPNDYLAIEGLLVIGILCSGTLLWVMVDLARTTTLPLASEPAFWVFSGALVYFGGTIPILGAWRYIGVMDHELSQVMYWIVVLLAIVRYGFVAFAAGKGPHRFLQS